GAGCGRPARGGAAVPGELPRRTPRRVRDRGRGVAGVLLARARRGRDLRDVRAALAAQRPHGPAGRRGRGALGRRPATRPRHRARGARDVTGRQADAPAADVGADPLTLGELADKDVSVLKGVGPKKLEGLRALGIGDLHALLTHYPRRYVDRTREARISDLRVGEEALVIGRVASVSAQRTRNRRVMVHAEVRDATGSMRVTFFNQPWRERPLSAISGEVAFFGKV